MVRENLMIMDAANTTFRKPKTVQLSRSLTILLIVIFIVCLVATGLLVNNFSSCSTFSTNLHETQTKCQNVQQELSPSTERTIKDHVTVLPDELPATLLPTSPISTEVPAKTDLKDLDLRLPGSVIPHSYRLKIIPFIQEGNFTFCGDVKILVNVTEYIDSITLHSDDLIIDSVSVTNFEGDTISYKDARINKNKQFLIIDLLEKIRNGQYYIYIAFKGVLNDLLQGFYRSRYEEDNETRWIAATQFQPTDARKCFPCFDEPGLKAKFKISIARLKNMTSVSNMRKFESIEAFPELPSDYMWDHYEESPCISTYLIAFVVSDFGNITDGNFSIWARKSALSQAKYSLQIGPKILRYYEDFFGIKYPLPKLDMVAIPDFSTGAMENWGLITYREPVLLYEKGVSSRSSLQRISHVVAHELAHQWFGNLVTPTWWNDLWLNEGFATYVEFLGSYAVGPKWKDPDLFLVSELHGAFSSDALKTSHPISMKVNNPDEVNDIFDRISYSKGASIIRMMQYFLTAEVFHNGLNRYLISRMYGNAEQDDLWRTLTEVGHESGVLDQNITVKEIMDTWTLQTGYPVILTLITSERKWLTLTQERFYLDLTSKEELALWWVPITYLNKNGKLLNSWMKKEKEITLNNIDLGEDDWYLINVNQTGFYRVNYEIENWKKLEKQLKKKDGHLIFDPKNRAQMLDDALNLAFSGYLSYDVALNITLYLINEREYVPWRAGLENLNFLYDMFVRTAHFEKYKAYMLYLIKGFYYELGFQDSKDDDPLIVLSRMDTISKACSFGLRNCISNAVQQFQNWKNSANPDNDNSISPDLREVIYCTAISNGGQEEWDFAWQRYLFTNVANEKEILLTALSCSKEIWILSRYLEKAISKNSGIRKHDSARVFAAVSENPVGQDLAYRFLKTNWNRIRSYLGPSSMLLGSIVKTTTAHFNTEEEVNDFKSFLNRKYSEFGIALRPAQQSIEQAEANVIWMKEYFVEIVQWLSKCCFIAS